VVYFGVSFEPDTEPAKEHYMNMYGYNTFGLYTLCLSYQNENGKARNQTKKWATEFG
jgi:hypothetical protein